MEICKWKTPGELQHLEEQVLLQTKFFAQKEGVENLLLKNKTDEYFCREPSYDLNCVTLEKDGNDDSWNLVTHNCSETSDLYPICEYPYYPTNFSIEVKEGNVIITNLLEIGIVVIPAK